MGHHVIIVDVKQAAKDRGIVRLGQLHHLVERLEGEHGPLKCFRGNPDRAAEQLSALPIVNHVTVVHVSETACGVWRRGRKS